MWGSDKKEKLLEELVRLTDSQLKVLNEILAVLKAQSGGKPIALKFTLGKAVNK